MVSDSSSVAIVMDVVNLDCVGVRMAIIAMAMTMTMAMMAMVSVGVGRIASAPASGIFVVGVRTDATMRVYGIVRIVVAWRMRVATILVSAMSVVTVVTMANARVDSAVVAVVAAVTIARLPWVVVAAVTMSVAILADIRINNIASMAVIVAVGLKLESLSDNDKGKAKQNPEHFGFGLIAPNLVFKLE